MSETPIVAVAPRELTKPTAIVFRVRAEDALAPGGVTGIIVDLTDAGYIDAVGLGALVNLHRRAHLRGKRVVLAGLNDDLRTLFGMTKLDTLFHIAETISRAVELVAEVPA